MNGTDDDAELRAGYCEQLRTATRDTTLIAGVVALVAFPAWALFDELVLPERASSFLTIRLVFEVLIAGGWLALWWRRIGGRWPEATSLALVSLPVVAIALMVSRSGDRIEAYLLGMSLPLYASGCLIIWRWRLTLALVGVTAIALAVCSIGADPGLARADVASAAFYLATAAVLAVAAQAYREHTGWQRYVTQAALEAEQRRNEALVAELDQLSREDPLTAVGNRRAWDERLVGEFLRAKRSGRPLSVIVCDVDHFKVINDSHGHAIGDQVLRSGAAVLAGRVRATDFVARLGGDEFGILCPETALAAATRLAGELADRARAGTFPADVALRLSFGVAELAAEDTDVAALVKRADKALYEAKETRDTVRCALPA